MILGAASRAQPTLHLEERPRNDDAAHAAALIAEQGGLFESDALGVALHFVIDDLNAHHGQTRRFAQDKRLDSELFASVTLGSVR